MNKARMENYYLRFKRNVIHTALEDIEDTDWFWCPSEIQKFDELWEQDKSIKEMAQELRRTEIAILLLSLDRIFKGEVKPREWRIW
jgi:hypothetical protein